MNIAYAIAQKHESAFDKYKEHAYKNSMQDIIRTIHGIDLDDLRASFSKDIK
jgi:hypothetical protein